MDYQPRALSYNLPPPHRLGSSRWHQRGTHSATTVATPANLVPLAESSLQQLSTSLGFGHESEGTDGADEPDSGRELGRKAAPSTRSRGSQRMPRAKAARVEPVVKLSSGPLTEFALFLPPRIPAVVLGSQVALAEFVKSTCSTYLSLWEFSKKMKLLDLRFPTPYDEKLAEDFEFIAHFISIVTERLSSVKSVSEVYLPQVLLRLHAAGSLSSYAKLEEVLQPLTTSKIAIDHLFLPLKSALQKAEIAKLDIKPLASLLQKATTIKELTIVSSAPVTQEFHKQLRNELKKGSKVATVKLNHSTRDTGAPGPAYIASMNTEHPVGEMVDPYTLVGSLNTDTERGGLEDGGRRGRREPTMKSKTKEVSLLHQSSLRTVSSRPLLQ